MALENYDDLKSSIADWLDKDNLTAVIPDFIRLAESRFDRIKAIYKQRTNILTVTKSVTALPDDFKEFGDWGGIYFDDGTRQGGLDFVGAESSALTEGISGIKTGYPRRATMLDTDAGPKIFTSPAPDDTFELKLIYGITLDKLSSTVSTNWLLDAAPDIYLFGALLESAPYIKDDPKIPIWRERFDLAIAELSARNQRFYYGTSRSAQPIRKIGP